MSEDRRRRALGVDTGPQRVGEAIAKVLSRIGVSPSAHTMELVFSRWDEVAGAEISRHVRPLRLQNAGLVVAADHPIWATRARMASGQILGQLRQLGDTSIERIEVVVQRS